MLVARKRAPVTSTKEIEAEFLPQLTPPTAEQPVSQ
jgi:hypothetical protein